MSAAHQQYVYVLPGGGDNKAGATYFMPGMHGLDASLHMQMQGAAAAAAAEAPVLEALGSPRICRWQLVTRTLQLWLRAPRQRERRRRRWCTLLISCVHWAAACRRCAQ